MSLVWLYVAAMNVSPFLFASESPSSLRALGMQEQVARRLEFNNIRFIDQLEALSEVELSGLYGVGPGFLGEIRNFLKRHGRSLGPHFDPDGPLSDRSVEVLSLPLKTKLRLRTKGLDQIGQLIMLNELEATAFLHPQAYQQVCDALAEFDLSFGSAAGKYDVPVALILRRGQAKYIVRLGLSTAKAFSLLSSEEFHQFAKYSRVDFHLLQASLRQKDIVLGRSPFLEFPLHDRIALWRAGIHSFQDFQGQPRTRLYQLIKGPPHQWPQGFCAEVFAK